MPYFIVVSREEITTKGRPVLHGHICNWHQLLSHLLVFIFLRNYREPCQYSPVNKLGLSTSSNVRQSFHNHLLHWWSKNPDEKFWIAKATTWGSNLNKFPLFFFLNGSSHQIPSFSRIWSEPVPKLSSPHIDSLPSSIRFPKNFQPVGTYN